MKIFYSDTYELPSPAGHRFPMKKYRMLRDYLLESKIIAPNELHESQLATEDELKLAHTELYIEQMKTGTVPHEQMKRIGFGWSPELFVRSCATVGGALLAAKEALKDGISGNLAGGTHHSHADRGEGYCVFNDIAVATRYLMKEKLVSRVAIIDLDVHQGNGNSSILINDSNVFIFSMHGEKNYPFKKIDSHLDIGLESGCGDAEYLEKLSIGMEKIEDFNPDYIFYQMGVDSLAQDKLGQLNLTHDGLIKRDELVLSYAFTNEIPLSLALGGGYADPIIETVIAYANTYRVVKRIYGI